MGVRSRNCPDLRHALANRLDLRLYIGASGGSLSLSRSDPEFMLPILSRPRPVLPGETLPPPPVRWPGPAPVLPSLPRP